MFRSAVLHTCFSLTLLTTASVAAAERDPSGSNKGADKSSYSWGLGIAGSSQQQAYTGIDRNNSVIPLIYFENRWVELMGPWLDIKLPGVEWREDQELTFTLRTHFFGFDGYKAGDARILNGMDERKAGIFAGPTFKWSNPIADVFGEAMFDASGNSKGQRFSLGVERQFHLGDDFMITPGVTAIWSDKKYANYYYGVRSTEALAARPEYTIGDSTVNTEFTLRADYFINPRQAVFLQTGYTVLDSKIKDSPLTDSSGETMVLLGYLYRFK